MTNEEVMQLMTDMGLHEGGMDDWVFDNAWVMFANAVASAEREAWEHRYARLQSLMDVRETQPNKPCCLAEREACANICETLELPEWPDKVRQPLAQAIRARGQA